MLIVGLYINRIIDRQYCDEGAFRSSDNREERRCDGASNYKVILVMTGVVMRENVPLKMGAVLFVAMIKIVVSA